MSKLRPLHQTPSKDDYSNFPIDVFPAQVTEYMTELRDKLGCNPNYMAGAFMCAASICKSLVIRDTWREWCLLANNNRRCRKQENPVNKPFFTTDPKY